MRGASARAQALRRARSCYDHLAGRLGVALMSSMLDQGALTGGDGTHHANVAGRDLLAAPGRDVDYRLTDVGRQLMDDLDVRIPATRRRLIGYCVDWTEQRHHLAGALGAALLSRFEEWDWLCRDNRHCPRALSITAAG